LLAYLTPAQGFLPNPANPLHAPPPAPGYFVLLLLLFVATLPLMHFSMQFSMTVLFLVCGPMQLVRSVPYDIRVLILTHSRISFLVLRLTSEPLLLPERRRPQATAG
jgi:hypothetical protein